MWQQEQWFNRHNFINDLFAGIMSAMMILMVAISLSALVCGAMLTVYLPQMITIFLASSIISLLIYAIVGSFSNASILTQDIPALLTALIAVTVYGIRPVVDETYFATVVVAMALMSMSGGLFMLLMGYFKQGNIVRFVPYPVIAGFLAGLGGLLFLSIWPGILGQPLTWHSLPDIFQFQYRTDWIPAMLLAISLQYFYRRYSYPTVILIVILSFLIIFFIAYFIFQYLHQPVEEWHLFLGPFPETTTYWPWLRWGFIQAVNWSLLWQVWDKMILIFILAPIAILINSASFETLSNQNVNFDRELAASGITGVCAPLFGGAAWSYIAVGTSFLNYKLGGRYRIINIIAALMVFSVLWMGTKTLGYIPRFLAPGLLLFISIDFLIDWLYKPYKSLSKKDYGIIVLIFITIIGTQFFYGIILGIAISLLKFAWEYSRLDPIDGIYSGEALVSHVVRAPKESQFLSDHGAKICLIRLHGHLFFGNVYRVFQRIRLLLDEQSHKKPIQYLIFDFSAVDGIDSSCRSSIRSFLAKAKAQKILVLTVGLFSRVANAEKELQGADLDKAHDHIEVNNALEWCEQALLSEYQGIEVSERTVSIIELKEELQLSAEDFSTFLSFWSEPKIFGAKEIIIHQDNKDKDIYFLERGILAVKIIEEGTKEINVVNIHAGSLFGEVAYYTGQARTTNIECINECAIYCLSFEAFKQLEEKYPAIALRLHKHIALQMAENIKYANQMLQMVLHYH